MTERPLYARPGPQAFALLVVFAADGLAARALGGPGWLPFVYAGLGAAFALCRLAVARRHRPARARPERGTRPARPDRIAIGYVQAADTAAWEAHKAGIAAYSASNGLELTTVVHDVERPAGESDGRPALRWALERIAAGEAHVLVVSRLAHLYDDVPELSALLRWFATQGRALVAVDLRLDTATKTGRLAAAALEEVGGAERIAPPPPATEPAPERRASAGRAAVADRPELQRRILVLREQGMTLQAIADLLNQEGVPTVRGGAMWRPSSVQRAAGYHRPRRPQRGIEVPRGRSDAPRF
jgi:hypothetical protein